MRTRDLIRYIDLAEHLGMSPEVHGRGETAALFREERTVRSRVGEGLRRFCNWAEQRKVAGDARAKTED